MSLKLLANDADDLKIIASTLQDAILRVGDIRYDPVARSVSLRMTRFRHETKKAERVECGVRIDGVMGLQSRGIERGQPDAFLVLLDLTFEHDDAPAGHVDVTLAGGGALRLTVEGLDLMLSDVGESRRTRVKPDHDAS